MFSGKKSNKPQNRIDTLIGAGTKIEGNITFSGGLRVDGTILGNICAQNGEPSTLVLSETAHIEGEIRVSHMVINGTVNGPVYVVEYVELQPKAHVIGDVYYKTVEMHLGARVEGKLVYQGEGSVAQSAVKPSLVNVEYGDYGAS
ncbi:MAG: bactofilin family protein [Burkholderiales bacterium]|nr:polymer-forming cytoskeletal protein [Sulfuricellaceae bacterium]